MDLPEDRAAEKPRTGDGAPEDGPETSGVVIDGPRAAFRIGLIMLVALAILALGFHQARILPRLHRPRPVFGTRKADLSVLPADFPLLAGDVALMTEPVVINGLEVASVRFASSRSPGAIVADYAALLKEEGYAVLPPEGHGHHQKGGFVGFASEDQAMLGFRDFEGRFMGIVAFANTVTGGSDYFVTRDGSEPELGRRPGNDVPGDVPGDIEPPTASVREYCVERRGDHPSILALYWCDASPAMVARRYRAAMAERGWEEPPGADMAFRGAPGGEHLLFRRGSESCLANVVEADGEAEAWLTLVYRKGR